MLWCVRVQLPVQVPIVPARRLVTRWHLLSMAMWKLQYSSARICSKSPQFCQSPLLTLSIMGCAKTSAHSYMYNWLNDHLSHLAHTWLHKIENSVLLVTYDVSVNDHVSNTHTSRSVEWYGVHLFIQRGIQTSGGENQLLVEQLWTIGVPRIMQWINQGIWRVQGNVKAWNPTVYSYYHTRYVHDGDDQNQARLNPHALGQYITDTEITQCSLYQ